MTSPFSEALPLASQFHLVPISPTSKAPSEYKNGKWFAMREWQKYRAKPASQLVQTLWASWPECNVGVVTGTQVDENNILAVVDFDTDDYDVLQTLEASLPVSPLKKKGRRGYSAFYRVPINTKGFRFPEVELLTDTRQTVIPPSVHPDTGKPYVWLSFPSNLNPSDLPIIDMDKFREAVESITKQPIRPDKPIQPIQIDQDAPWHRKLNNQAYANLDAWVPELGLPKLSRVPSGYKGVAFWRESSTGRNIRDRNPNLSIITNGGAKDFGRGDSYTAINLVMAAKGFTEDDACRFLADRLGLVEEFPIQQEVTVINNHTESFDPETGEILSETQEKTQVKDELPDEYTDLPGLLGEVVNYIVMTSRRPHRGLALAAAMTLLGTLAGQCVAGPTRSSVHLYCVGIGKSGAGKQHFKKCINDLLDAANLQGDLIGPSSFKSDSAMVRFLQRKSRSICVMDEIGEFFKKMNDSKNSFASGISAIMRELWGLNFDSYMTPEWASSKSERIQWPAMSVLGFTTEAELFKALTGGDVSNGFLNRWMVFESREKPKDRTPLVEYGVPEGLALRLNQFEAWTHRLTENDKRLPIGSMRDIKRMTWGDGAHEIYKELMARVEAIEDKSDDGSESFFARCGEIAVRMASIRALGEGQMAVDTTVMQWASDVAWHSCHRLETLATDRIAENDQQRMYNMVWLYIKKEGQKGLTHQKLSEKLKGRMKAQQIKEIIQLLCDADKISVGKRMPHRPQGGGRIETIYTATNP